MSLSGRLPVPGFLVLLVFDSAIRRRRLVDTERHGHHVHLPSDEIVEVIDKVEIDLP